MKQLAIPALLASAFVNLATAAPKAELFIDGLKKPVFMTAPAESTDYLYILEKDGTIRLFDRAQKKLLDKPFLDIRDRIKINMNEQGLLGLALSPDFNKNGRYYVYYTDRDGDTCVSRFTRDQDSPLTSDAQKEEILLKVPQDFKNHNGGWIGFGPDKMLYIGLGDGGSGNDPKQRAQDLTSHLGKLLRIDVSAKKGYTIPRDNPFARSKSAKPEILSYGLRNPWRCAWEGDSLIIADVGQNQWEEINSVPHKKLFKANFGWPQLEGTHKTSNPATNKKNPGSTIDPVFEYSHGTNSDQGYSLTGGYVYNGSVESLKGRYIFADYILPNIWSTSYSSKNGKMDDQKNHSADFQHNGKTIAQISSFAEDPQGELYIISHHGQIFLITE